MPAKILQLSPAVPPGARLPEIDRLKGLALLLVVANHASGTLGLTDWVHGELGVDMFLILSGFSLALGSGQLSVGQFMRRRFLRIFPAYWFALGLFLWGNARFFADHRPAADIWLHVAGLHAFGRPEFFSSINDSFWFISIIVLLYGIFCGLRRHLHDLGLIAGVGSLVTAIVCGYYLSTGNPGALLHLGVRLPDLFIGMILGQLASGRKAEFRASAILAIGLAALAYVAVWRGINFGDPVGGLAWIIAYLWVDRLAMKTPAGPAFAALFSFLGLFSYEIYLLHQPLIRDYSRVALAAWWGVADPSRLDLALALVGALIFVLFLSVWLHRATAFIFNRFRPSSPA